VPVHRHAPAGRHRPVGTGVVALVMAADRHGPELASNLPCPVPSRGPPTLEVVMAKRMILMLVLVLLLVGGLGVVKFQQTQVAIAEGAAYQPPPEAVTTIVAAAEAWPETIHAIGTVEAVRGVTVSADLSGTVDRVAFESGRAVEAGAVLVELDTRQERAQLAAAEAARDLARVTFQRMEGLLAERVISRAEFDRATADSRATEARVGEIRAAIDRKTIRAPLRTGRAVRISLDPRTGVVLTGQITALDSAVDEATRNVQVQATLPNSGGVLRPGMFVETEVVLGAGAPVITLPASAVNSAPFGDSVFVVADLEANGRTYRGVRQRFVKLGATRGDQVAVRSGLEPGEEVVTSGVFKLRTGVAVHVDNSIQPGNNPAPRPENQ
jgi:membrane fusion protein, multidrug efflux system